MNLIEFLKPRFKGKRFENHTLPFDVLKDLIALNEMIIDLSKSLYLIDNPDRKRTPRGFYSDVELRLQNIEEGSSIPVICLLVTTLNLFPIGSQEYLERSRDLILRSIDNIRDNELVNNVKLNRFLSYFNRIGRNINDEECIDFNTPNASTPVTLTKEKRIHLSMFASNSREYSETVCVRGTIPEFDQDKNKFEFKLVNDTKIVTDVSSQHFDVVMDAFSDYKIGKKVLINGVGKFNQHRKLISFESIEDIEILDKLDISSRLDEIQLLKDGWLDGYGLAFNEKDIDRIKKIFSLKYPEGILPLPYIYPTEDSNIQAEWSINNFEITLLIDVKSLISSWHSINMSNLSESSFVVDLNTDEGWKNFLDGIMKCIGGRS